MSTQARAANVVRNVGFGFFSIAVHLCMVVVAVLIASPVVRAYKEQRELIDVDIQPALGQPHGKDDGKGLGSHVEIPRAPELKAPDRPPPAPPPDPEAIPTAAASASAASSAAAMDADAGPPVEAGAGDNTGTADLTTPVGSENVAPAFGSPDGVEGGQGTAPPKAKMTPQYAGILAGWFGARFNVRGADIPADELPKLRVAVRISLSADRQVTGWSLAGSSGNAAFDDAVKRTMSSIQGGGATLPPPPDGGDAPPAFTTVFGPVRVAQN